MLWLTALFVLLGLVAGSFPQGAVINTELPTGPEAFSFYDGTPRRWASCDVTWSLAPSGAGLDPELLADVTEAFSRLGELTGYRFKQRPANGEISIAVGEPAEPEEHDAHGTLDTAGSTTVSLLAGEITAAEVVLDAETTTTSPSGFASMDANGVLVLHELAHAVGLDHVNHGTSLMHPVQSEASFSLSPGDRRGLSMAGGRCFGNPTALAP